MVELNETCLATAEEEEWGIKEPTIMETFEKNGVTLSAHLTENEFKVDLTLSPYATHRLLTRRNCIWGKPTATIEIYKTNDANIITTLQAALDTYTFEDGYSQDNWITKNSVRLAIFDSAREAASDIKWEYCEDARNLDKFINSLSFNLEDKETALKQIGELREENHQLSHLSNEWCRIENLFDYELNSSITSILDAIYYSITDDNTKK